MAVLFFEHPTMHAFAPPHRRFMSSPCGMRRGGCAMSPCFFPMIFFALLFTPLGLALGKLVFTIMSFVGLTIIYGTLTAFVVGLIGDACSNGNNACGPSAAAARRSCPWRRMAATVRDELKKEEKKEEATEEPSPPHLHRQHAMKRDDDKIRLSILTPGIALADLSLDILDNVLRVSGQTKDRRVDRRILLPCNADPETLSATYADGEITIVMERKAGKKIAIKKTPVVFGHHPQAPSEKEEAAAAGPRERADKKETAHEPQEEEMTTAESKEPSLQRKSDARSAEEVKETGEEEWEEWPKDASSDC